MRGFIFIRICFSVQDKETEVERLSKQLEELNNNNVAKIDRYLSVLISISWVK